MSHFLTDKVYVNYRNGYAQSNTLSPRKYTLTHSDITAELFLNIGSNYATDKITKDRDEVLGEWILENNQHVFHVYLHVDGETEISTSIRNEIFIRELPLALKAIKYGDTHIFQNDGTLNYATIIVHFQSKNPSFNRTENWGRFYQYDQDELYRYF